MLHDKATRGVELSPAGKAELEAWYAEQDRQEAAELAGFHPASNIESLRAQVENATARPLAVSQQIQTLSVQNEDLRREIVLLKQQLAEKMAVQPA